jgi:hypothetical protein
MDKTEIKGYISLEDLKSYLESLMPKDKKKIMPEDEKVANAILDIYNWVKVKIRTDV